MTTPIPTPVAPAPGSADLGDRRTYLGGSDVAVILGLDPFKSPRQLWLEKTGQVPMPVVDNVHVRRGHRQEPVALAAYQEQLDVRDPREVLVPATLLDERDLPLVHAATHPFLRGHVDAIALPADRRGALREVGRVIEAKAPALGTFLKYQREGLPDRYIIQLQSYLTMFGLARGEWVIFSAEHDQLLPVPVERDPVVEEAILEQTARFWRCVETLTPPPEETVAEALPPLAPDEQTLAETRWESEEARRILADYREARALAESAKALKDEAEARVRALIAGKPGRYEAEGIGRVVYVQTKGARRFDAKKLAALAPLDRDRVLDLVATMVRETGGAPDDTRARELAVQALAGCELDLDACYTTSAPGTQLRFTPARVAGGEE